MLEQEIIQKLRKIENDLSPENLSCDGEAHPDWVRRRSKELLKEKMHLIGLLGREPSFEELYGFKPRVRPEWAK